MTAFNMWMLMVIFVEDDEVLVRIKKLVLPPAWENVWICADPNGHLQATGVDTKGRKQYRYHPDWNTIRSQTKYYRLPQFADALPLIREHLERDLKNRASPTKKYWPWRCVLWSKPISASAMKNTKNSMALLA